MSNEVVFHQELTKQRLFETVRVSTSQMKVLFGIRRISSSSELPETFLSDIENATGANGVLLVDLDSYRAYKPLALSVRSKLVDIKSADFLWAIDETFDAGQPGVIVAANQFQRVVQVNNISARTDWQCDCIASNFRQICRALHFLNPSHPLKRIA